MQRSPGPIPPVIAWASGEPPATAPDGVASLHPAPPAAHPAPPASRPEEASSFSLNSAVGVELPQLRLGLQLLPTPEPPAPAELAPAPWDPA
ncbi:MAG: hypothetical protein LC792_09675, partial [Actinobacteria bacterium]|nr:hypothetical protein [Actinomycetota bacterium]